MKKVYLIEGEKGSGKSKWIHDKKDELISSGWELIKPHNSPDRDTDASDWNTAIFVLKRESQIAVLNSGSDTKLIIEKFRDFLSGYTNVSEVYTAIRPRKKNPRLHKWMKDALNVLGTTEEITVYP